MADILEEVRKTAERFNAYGGVLLPPGFSADILDKSAKEIDKLRKENKDLKAKNTTLITRHTLLFLIFAGAVMLAFMTKFISG